jgi:hypothetical protein
MRGRELDIIDVIGFPLNDGCLLGRNQSYAIRTGLSQPPTVLALMVKAEPSGTMLDNRHGKPAPLQFGDKLLEQRRLPNPAGTNDGYDSHG